MESIKHKKNVHLVNYFAVKAGGTINRMKMLKLVWLSDRLHLNKYGRTVSTDHYVAMKNGPVASEIKDISEGRSTRYSMDYIEPVGRLNFKSLADAEPKHFSKTDLEVMEAVWERFGRAAEFDLSNLSHEYPEWKRHEDYLKKHLCHSMKFEDFFLSPTSSPIAQADFFSISDEQLEASKKMFQEMQEFTRTLEAVEFN